MEEELKTNSEKVEREANGQLKKGVILNPKGRPKGSLHFQTKWKIFVEKVAAADNMTPDEIDEQLLAVGFKKAKEGDYNFYKDIHDRVYGKPIQPTDLTTKGESLNTLSEEDRAKLDQLLYGEQGSS